MGQVEGILGGFVDRMIRRSVKRTFHGVHWIPPKEPLQQPCILVANHHGWHDGYVMYHAVRALGMPTLLWIEEFDAFPLFAKVGGLPFPAGDSARRASAIRKTVRLMQTERRSLLLFPEGELHPPPSLLPFGRSLDFLVRNLPEAPVVPVAIRYEHSMHERPECFLIFDSPVNGAGRKSEEIRLVVSHLQDELTTKLLHDRSSFQCLVKGTPDVNERWDMRRIIRR